MKKIIIVIMYLTISILPVFSYEVELPSSNGDVKVLETTIDSDNTEYINVGKKVNDYIWIFTGVVSLAVVAYGGFLLISSNGAQEDLKKGNNILIWGLVGIFVSLFASLVVRLLMDLF